MDKHAVPQNIMDIEFKLFGSLTVRQFAYLAISGIGCLILYTSGLPEVVTIPIIIAVVLVAMGLAFFTINGQPFAVWLGNFVASLFNSQRKIYRKTDNIPKVLARTYATPKAAKPISAMQKKMPLPFVVPAVNSYNPAPGQDLEGDILLDDPLSGDKVQRLETYFQDKAGNINSNYVAPARSTVQDPNPGLQSLPNLQINIVSGIVINTNSIAVPNAKVSIITFEGATVASTSTNVRGEFNFRETAPDGRFLITVSHPQYTFPSFALDLKGEVVPTLSLKAVT